MLTANYFFATILLSQFGMGFTIVQQNQLPGSDNTWTYDVNGITISKPQQLPTKVDAKYQTITRPGQVPINYNQTQNEISFTDDKKPVRITRTTRGWTINGPNPVDITYYDKEIIINGLGRPLRIDKPLTPVMIYELIK